MFFSQMLNKLNRPCDTANDGHTGLEKVRDRINMLKDGHGKNYNLILIDYNMPDMLGTEVAVRICKMYREANIA